MKAATLLLVLGAAVLSAQGSPHTDPVARRTGTFKDTRLRESSGVVASRRHPGLLWTLNDSGNDPALFLTDTLGTALGVYPVSGASNRDWEALGMGHCGSQDCLVIGDTGDNGEHRTSVTLYRVPEPDPLTPARPVSGRTESLELRYPTGSYDVEALYVEPDGGVILITKGRHGGILAFRVPASAWGTGRLVIATRVDSVPMPASLMTGRVVTDAAMSPDGKRVAVRTYRDVHFFVRSQDGRLTLDPDHPVCDISGKEPQGEGIDWWDDQTLVLTSERGTFSAGTITLLRCPGR